MFSFNLLAFLILEICVCETFSVVSTWNCKTVYIPLESVDDSIIRVSIDTRSVLECASVCRYSSCASIYFRTSSGKCAINNKLANFEGVETFSQQDNSLITYCPQAKTYGDTCSSSGDCIENNAECTGGTCSCQLFYSFDSQRQDCVGSCSDYGSTYQEVLNHGLVEHNTLSVLNVVSAVACRELCTKEASFNCRSVEYSTKHKSCSLSTATVLTAAESYVSNNDFDYYHRNCA